MLRVKRVKAAIGDPKFAERDTEQRFLAAFSAASRADLAGRDSESQPEESRSCPHPATRSRSVVRHDRELKLSIDKKCLADVRGLSGRPTPGPVRRFSEDGQGQENNEA